MIQIATPQQSLPTSTTSRVPIPSNPKSQNRHSRIPNPKNQKRHSRISLVKNKDGIEPTVPLLETELGGAIAKSEKEGNGHDKGCGSSKGADEGQSYNKMANLEAILDWKKYKTTIRAQHEDIKQSTIQILSKDRPPPERDRRETTVKGCRVRTNSVSREGVLELVNSMSRSGSVTRHE